MDNIIAFLPTPPGSHLPTEGLTERPEVLATPGAAPAHQNGPGQRQRIHKKGLQVALAAVYGRLAAEQAMGRFAHLTKEETAIIAEIAITGYRHGLEAGADCETIAAPPIPLDLLAASELVG
jgi:hypothetical protein